MKTRIHVFFTVAICAMIIKLTVIAVSDYLSAEFNGESLNDITALILLLGFLSILSDLSFSSLIFYYLSTTVP